MGSRPKKGDEKNSKSKGKGKSTGARESTGREAQILAEAGIQGERSTFEKMLEKVLNNPKRPRPNYTKEELAEHFAIGRTYNVMMARWHNKMEKAMTCRVKLKLDACKNLPEHVRLLAEQAPQATMPPTPLPLYLPNLLPFGRQDAIKNRT